jgi:hypothetical protein
MNKVTSRVISVVIMVLIVGFLANFGYTEEIFSYTAPADGFVCKKCDSRFVNVKGDTMSGDLHVGSVGIGTTSPEAALHLSVDGTRDSILYNDAYGSSWNPQIILRRALGTYTFPIPLPNGTPEGDAVIGWLLWRAFDTDGEFKTVGNIEMDVDAGGSGSSTRPGRFEIWTVDQNTLINTERMRIDSSGNTGIGTTSPSEKLDVEGYIKAWGYYTGDIIFQKDGRKLYRMFEKEDGLYLENLKTGQTSRIFLEEDFKLLKEELNELRREISAVLKKSQ